MAQQRHYLMCRPDYFAVTYAINPWMHPEKPVDPGLAVAQWENLRQVYLDLGHRVSLIDPLPGLPDMVFAANGAVVVGMDDRSVVFGTRFRHPQRRAEEEAYAGWFEARDGFTVHRPRAIAEGEGDFLVTDDYVLAGTGFRSDLEAHNELAKLIDRPVVTLRLIDPRYYHLDTALTVLDEERGTVAYLPGAFAPSSRKRLRQLFPDAIEAGADDAAVFGLNAVSDGRHVVLPEQAVKLAEQYSQRGFEPITVDLSELRKAGGGPKCCTLEVRGPVR
ncbi:dimethylarginine dimethylaminohydrolase family protein [Flindersiella endophytica]